MFRPYSMNGGTTLGLSGEGFALVASDTRLCEEDYYMIYSRKSPHIYKLGKHNILGAVGFYGDVLTLTKLLESRVKDYKYDHGKEISTKALAALLSVTLYNRRFFPFYVSNILVGLDENGHGALYDFDPVGSYERESYRAVGSSGAIIQPLLDSRINGGNNALGISKLDKASAIALAKDIFISAAERDIHCGDAVSICIITKEGVEELEFPLRRD